MRNAYVYFVVQSLHWFIICTIAWSWCLGADVPAWKMATMAVVAGFVSTVCVPVQVMLGSSKNAAPADRSHGNDGDEVMMFDEDASTTAGKDGA